MKTTIEYAIDKPHKQQIFVQCSKESLNEIISYLKIKGFEIDKDIKKIKPTFPFIINLKKKLLFMANSPSMYSFPLSQGAILISFEKLKKDVFEE